MPEISVIISAYNEKTSIGITLTKIIAFFNDYNPNYEIIVVDDGSTDNTAELVENIRAGNEKLIIVRNSHKGKGYGVKSGVERSSGRYVLLSDADLATPIEELKRLMIWVSDNNFDIAIGSREGVGAIRKNEPLIRHIMGRIFNFIIKILILPGINDTQCGFKLFKGALARKLFSKSLLYGENTKEVKVPKVTAFDVEILFLARKMKAKIKEVPIMWEYGRNTRVNKFRDSIINLLDVVKVKVNDLRGLYNSI